MVFYLGRAPNGEKTEWKMNEYKSIQPGDYYSSSSSSTIIPNIATTPRVHILFMIIQNP